MTYGSKLAVSLNHPSDVTLANTFVGMMYCTREYPRMKSVETRLSTFLKINIFIHYVISFLSLVLMSFYHLRFGRYGFGNHHEFIICSFFKPAVFFVDLNACPGIRSGIKLLSVRKLVGLPVG